MGLHHRDLIIRRILGGGAAVLVEDSFNRADSASSLGTADSGGAWTATNTWGISGNQAYRVTAGAGYARLDTGQSDVDFTIDITIGSNAEHRIAGLTRYVDTSNYFVVELIKLTNGVTAIRARERLANVPFSLFSVSTPALSNDTTYSVRFVIIEQHWQFFIDGALILSGTLSDAEYAGFGSAQNIGLYAEENGSRFDNLLVRDVSRLPNNLAASTEARLTYPSTIDAITNLAVDTMWQVGALDLPLLIVMHGYNGAINDISSATITRLVNRGVFVAVVGMRERDSASGAKDSGAREIHDIYDVISFLRSRWSSLISPDRVALLGYSGGGGNAMAMAVKFPDSFTDLVSFFGISDYGFDATFGWWAQAPAYRTGTNNLEDTIGGTPAVVPDNYQARDHRAASANFTGGKMWLFHDKQDTTVPWSQSERFADVMQLAGLTPYENYTDTPDEPRWTHGYPSDTPDLIAAEDIFMPEIISEAQAVWTIPATGTIKVAGYIVTKRFSIWLGTLIEGGGGVSGVADVNYDTGTGEYTVTTSITMDVFIKQGILTASQNVTNSVPTLMTVS